MPALFYCTIILLSLISSITSLRRCDSFADREDGQIVYDPEEENGNEVGAIATLQCHNGNIRRLRCTENGWKPPRFIPCELLARDVPHEVEVNQVGVSGCPNLSNVSNGFVVYSPIGFEPFRPDTEATLMCNLGYTPHGNMVSKCSTDGSWSEIGGCYTPSSQQCLQLNEPLNGQVTYIAGLNGPHGLGATAEMTCNLGYTLQGSSSVTCKEFGWDSSPGSCVEGIGQTPCVPLTVFNGNVNYIQANALALYSSGTTAMLTCNAGFTPTGTTSTYCSGGQWSPPIGQCSSLGGTGLGGIGTITPGFGITPGTGIGTCPAMAIPINGQVLYSLGGSLGPFPSGTVATMVCNLGYTPSGTTTSTCQNGQWSIPTFAGCNNNLGLSNGLGGIGGIGGLGGTTGVPGAQCLAEIAPLNGQIQYSSTPSVGTYPSGSTATLICNAGTVVSGSATSFCRSGQWYPPVGSCVLQNSLANNLGGLGTTASLCPLGMVTPLNGRIQYSTGNTIGPFPQGSTATLICTTGIPTGTTTATCSYGQWLPPTFQACGSTNSGIGVVDGLGGNQCLTPPPSIGGTFQFSQGGTIGPFPSGTVATLICPPGQSSAGPTTASCRDGIWNPPTAGPCSAFGTGGVSPGLGGFGVGTTVPGFGIVGSGGTGAQCIIGLAPPINGRITYSQGGSLGPFPSGTSATLTCDIGYNPIGQTTSYCQGGSFQPASLGTCSSSATGSPIAGIGTTNCYSLPAATNGIISYTSLPTIQGTYSVGTTATLQCTMGFTPLGGTSSTCLTNGWSTYSLGSCISQLG